MQDRNRDIVLFARTDAIYMYREQILDAVMESEKHRNSSLFIEVRNLSRYEGQMRNVN